MWELIEVVSQHRSSRHLNSRSTSNKLHEDKAALVDIITTAEVSTTKIKAAHSRGKGCTMASLNPIAAVREDEDL